MKKISILLAVALAAACHDDRTVPETTLSLASENPAVEIDETGTEGTVRFDTDGSAVALTVKTNARNWETSGAPQWCVVDRTGTTLTLTAAENRLPEQRRGTLTVTAGAEGNRATAVLEMVQYGAEQAVLTLDPDSARFPAEGGSAEITVATNRPEWEAAHDADWLTIEKSDGKFIMHAAANESAEDRSAEVTVEAGADGNTAVQTLTVTQDGIEAATLEVSPLSAEFPPDGGSAEITVTTNRPEWEAAHDADWLTIEKSDGKFTLSADANNANEPRTATVTVTAGEGPGLKSAAVAVSQPAADKRLIIELTLAADGTIARLPLGGTVDCTIDWGDGSEPEAVTAPYPSHVYANAGTYEAAVSGTVTSLNGNNSSKFPTAARKLVTAVKQWGNTSLTSMKAAFYQCSNLSALPEKTGDGFAFVSTFMQAFYQCTSLAALPEDLFAAAEWNESFQYAFSGCTALENIPAGLFAGNPNVKSFQQTFNQCSALRTIPEGLFDAVETTAVTFASCFQDCKSLTTVPENLFARCREATTFSSCFQGCTALENIPAGLFRNNPAASFMANVFSGSGIKGIPAGLLDSQTAPELKLSGIFKNCKAIVSIPSGLFDNCTGAVDFSGAFEGCGELASIPAGLFDNCAKVRNFMSAFMNCTKLTSVPAGLFDNCKAVFNFKTCFSGCTALKGESPYSVLGEAEVHLYERNAHPDAYTAVTQLAGCFKGCTGLTDYPCISENYPDWL